nr:unnamed protein product [Callosobruchus chinensis]
MFVRKIFHITRWLLLRSLNVIVSRMSGRVLWFLKQFPKSRTVFQIVRNYSRKASGNDTAGPYKTVKPRR